MDKVKVKEFIGFAGADSFEAEFKDKKLILNLYLPVEEKISIAEQIGQTVFDWKTGTYDANEVHILTVCHVVAKYVQNITFPKHKSEDGYESPDIATIFNVAKSSGLYSFVLGKVHQDAEELDAMISNKLEQLTQQYNNKSNFRSVAHEVIELLSSEQMAGIISKLSEVEALKDKFNKEGVEVGESVV